MLQNNIPKSALTNALTSARRLWSIAIAVAIVSGSCVYLAAKPYDYVSFSYGAESLSRVGYDGVVVETPRIDLPPGRYEVFLDAQVWSGEYSFELFSPDYAGDDNSPGRVFATVPISTPIYDGAGRTRLEINSKYVIRGASLRVTRRDDSGEHFNYDYYDDLRVDGISGENRVFSDAAALAALTVICVAAAAFYLSRRGYKLRGGEYGEAAAIVCCVLAAAVSAAPISRLSLSYGHDIYFHLTRIEGIYEGLLSGQLPVRINPAFISGYGYADPIMYPPLFLYFPAALRLLRVSLTTSYQIFIFAVGLATAAVSSVCFRRFFGRRDLGIFAAAAYTLCLYRLICIFTRAAVGELLAMAFLPAAALGVYETFFGDERRGAGWMTLGFTGLLNSHVISTSIALVSAAVFAVVNIRRLVETRRLMALLSAAAVTLLLNMWILIPMLSIGASDINAVNANRDISGHAVYPAEMFATFIKPSGLSGDVSEPYTAMPLSVGGIFGIGALAFIFKRVTDRAGQKSSSPTIRRREDIIGGGGLYLSIAALFLASVLFPWRTVAAIPVLRDLLALAQFPWRYFGVASVGLTLVLTAAVGLFTRDMPAARRRAALTLCALGVFLAGSPYIDNYSQDSERTAVLPQRYSHLVTYAVGGQEYLRYGTSLDELRYRGPAVRAVGAEISSLSRSFTNIRFSYSNASDGAFAELPLYYYPGYTAVITDEGGGSIAPARAAPGSNGVVRVPLPPGGGTATVRYTAPISYRIAELISLVTAAAVAVLLIRGRRAHRQKLALD
ncbi:MAG: hypothetical protein LBH17_03025 [Oscillospiraceae bacterium]|jgi:hypothetical protein|nr:hypothetical protein [Oscillospiraceae bacterium]